jgi:hypothetical protein
MQRQHIRDAVVIHFDVGVHNFADTDGQLNFIQTLCVGAAFDTGAKTTGGAGPQDEVGPDNRLAVGELCIAACKTALARQSRKLSDSSAGAMPFMASLGSLTSTTLAPPTDGSAAA